MNEQVEFLRSKLEMLITMAESLVDKEIVSLSQELDKLILQYYLYEVEV